MTVRPSISALLLAAALLGCRDGKRASTAAAPAPTPAVSSATVLPDSDPIAQPDDHPEQQPPTLIGLDTPQTGVLESGDDRDWFAVNLAAGSRYDLSLASLGSTSLTLVAPDGITELAHAEGQNPRLAYVVPSSGRYLVRVGSLVGPLDYALVVTLVSP